MARIRTIKPDFWTNEKVMNSGALARLLFIGMWNFADDYGRLLYAPLSIKAKIFPNDNFAVSDVQDMLGELRKNGLLVIYSAAGKDYIEITGWDHQKIDKRQTSKIPGPDDAGSVVKEGSSTTSAESPRLPPTPAPVMEGKVEERKVYSEANASGADAPPDPAIPEREYFTRGREVLGKGAGGLIAKLLKAKGMNVSLARAALEQASQKENPTEYVAAVCRGPPAGKPLTEHQRKQAEARGILDEIGSAVRGRCDDEDPGAVRHDTSRRPPSLRGCIGGNLIDLSPSGNRSSG